MAIKIHMHVRKRYSRSATVKNNNGRKKKRIQRQITLACRLYNEINAVQSKGIFIGK